MQFKLGKAFDWGCRHYRVVGYPNRNARDGDPAPWSNLHEELSERQPRYGIETITCPKPLPIPASLPEQDHHRSLRYRSGQTAGHKRKVTVSPKTLSGRPNCGDMIHAVTRLNAKLLLPRLRGIYGTSCTPGIGCGGRGN